MGSTNTTLGRFLSLFRHSPPSLRHSLLLLLPHIVILLPLSESDLHVLRLDLLLIRLRDRILHGVPGVSVPSNSVSRLRFTGQSNPTMNRLSHFPLCAFLRLTLILLTAARLHVEFSGIISPHSLKSNRNTLLVEGLCVTRQRGEHHLASNSTLVAVMFTWMSSQPRVAGASHLCASFTLNAI